MSLCYTLLTVEVNGDALDVRCHLQAGHLEAHKASVLWASDETPLASLDHRYAAHGPAFGTVDRDYDTGEAPVKVTMPSGHLLTLDAEQPPIYAAEHLHAGQRVAWATWLAGNAVVGAD